MKSGNELMHLTGKALTDGFSDAPWYMLRNAYFSKGDPQEGWNAMVQYFKSMGVTAVSELRNGPQQQEEWVVLRPAPGATRSQE
ncbi:MAG: hypothetical protein K9K35_10540 [Rhodoferax sp.]|nr:hypothetical protein [Rhodoferax sp.]